MREDALIVSSKGWRLDPALIVDLMITGDHSAEAACLQSVTITPGMCSVVFGDPATGASIASATVAMGSPADVPLSPLVDGVGGFVSFGPALLSGRYQTMPAGMHIFGGETLIESRCVLFTGPMPVSGLVSPAGGDVLRGEIVISLGQELLASIVRSTDEGGDELDQVTLSLRDPAAFLSPCEEKTTSCGCNGTPISTINGVPGNTNGIITLEIEDENGSIYLLGPHTISLLFAAARGGLCQKEEEPDDYGRIKGLSGQYSDDARPTTPYNSPEDTTFPIPIL